MQIKIIIVYLPFIVLNATEESSQRLKMTFGAKVYNFNLKLVIKDSCSTLINVPD